MNRFTRRTSSLHSWVRLLGCSCVAALALSGTARGDDSEIYIPKSNVAPNIMLILDTSGSMQGSVNTPVEYDPKVNYIEKADGACSNIGNRIFWVSGTDQGTPPRCDSNDYFNAANLVCSTADSLLDTSGIYAGDELIQWREGTTSRRSWQTLASGVRSHVDCENDAEPYPDGTANINRTEPVYTETEADSFWNTKSGTSATLYTANYVAYYRQFRTMRVGTRLEVMQQAAKTLLNSASKVNVGLMRYSVNTKGATNDNPAGNGGGMVVAPVAPIAQNRADLISRIDGFITGGATPLSEALYEAHQYFSGGNVFFGNSSQACKSATNGTCDGNAENLFSVPGSRTGGVAGSNTYASPATQDCQSNYIVYLTDGEPNGDNKANGAITTLARTIGASCASSGDGRCLAALAQYMNATDLRGSIAGKQNVTTYFIGLGDAFGGTTNAAFQYLNDAAIAGGGKAYKAGDLSDLTRVFTNIFNEIAASSATLTAPTVAVNAFNRTQTLDDLYISVFQPKGGIRWPGNIKKYRIDDDAKATVRALDPANTEIAAIGTKGEFLPNTNDFWSKTERDGSKVDLGGAMRVIPHPGIRNVYTYLGATNPNGGAGLKDVPSAAVKSENDALTDALLDLDAEDNLPRKRLINWARGADVDADPSDDDDLNAAEQRFSMGDPMHSQPAVVIYGGTTSAKDEDDGVVFTATNDGYLHAFETKTGEELWAFIPKEMLPRLKAMYGNESVTSKSYALDGDLRVLKFDVNGDGIVDASKDDKVLLFFSTGRNPTVSRYYALDVTRKDAPRFLWSADATTLPGLGQAWSRPTISRVNIDVPTGTQNSQKLVLIFGGGYDPLEEGNAYVAQTNVGNRIFMVDALKGTLLWSAGDMGTNLNLDRMKHSIPAPVNVVDLDGDTFADRLYVGDMAAQLWRFDIYNGKDKAGLVTGGVIASLGAKEGTASPANTRRFYNSPDASLMQGTNGRPFINIAIGSGYRGHPLSTVNEDRFYSIRDYQPFVKLTARQYEQYDIVLDSELDDITTNFAPQLSSSSPGWLLQLNFPKYQGEKVLSSSSTLQNTIFFTSYTPLPSDTSDTCSPAQGSNRVYAISALDGSPLPRRDAPTDPNNPTPGPGPGPGPGPTDRFDDIGQTGIAPEVTILFSDKNQITCLSGVEVLGVCRDFNSRVKTYWRQTNAN